MATQPIKTRFELDGEQEYKAAVSEINASLRVLNSEMKLVSAQFATNADSVDALTARSDVLTRQILTQKEKVEALQAALKDSADRYGEADDRTKRWQTTLNNAEAELAKMEQQLQSNTEALSDATSGLDKLDGGLLDTTESGKGLGDTLDDLAGKLGADLPEGVTGAFNSMGELSGQTSLLIGAFAGAAAAIFEMGRALSDLTLEQASAAGEIQDLSMQTGLSTEAVQRYQYACDLIGVSFDTVASSQAKMIQSMADVQSGSETATATWNQLGIEVMNADGSLRNAEDVFLEVIDVLGQIENATQRDAVSMEIFGRSAQDLNPLIVQGTDAFQALCDEASKVGAVLTDVQLEALAGVDDALIRFNERLDAGEKAMALKFTPALQAFFDETGDGVKGIEEALADSGLVTVFASLLELVTALSPAFEVLGDVLTSCSPVFYAVAWVIATISDALKVVLLTLSSIVNILTLDFACLLYTSDAADEL